MTKATNDSIKNKENIQMTTFENPFTYTDTPKSTKVEVGDSYPVPEGALPGHIVAIVGSRDYDDVPRLLHTIEAFNEKYGVGMVVSGGASGADVLGEAWAMTNDIPTHIHLARWGEGNLTRKGKFGPYNPSAGIVRNTYIVRDADIVLAFTTDWAKSKGTADTIAKAHKAKVPTFIFDAKQGQFFTNAAADEFVKSNK